jgi:hypothetical protein
MNLFKTENENRDFFLAELKKRLPELNDEFKENKWNFMIDKEVPVPYRHIYFPVRKELEICCFKQDICIYTKLLDKSIAHREAVITAGDEKVLSIVLNKNAENNNLDIGLPFVIIETKMIDTIGTDSILACSEKVRMIKSIFPYCRSALLCFGDCNRNVYRLGSGFDELLFLKNLDEEAYTPVIERINDSLNHAAGNMICTA